MNYNIISDDYIKHNNSRILSGYKFEPRYVHEENVHKETHQSTQSEPYNKKSNVNDQHKQFLMALINCQFSKTLTEIYKIAGFTPGTGSRISSECVKKNLIKVIRVPFGKGGKPSYPVLTPDAYKILNVNEKKFSGRGAGYEHTLYQHLITEYFSEFKPVIELNRNNHFIDVGIETNEKLICIEVAMTSVHERENVEQDFLLAKADSIIIACINNKVQQEIEDILIEMPELIRNKTEVMLISELLKKNPEELIQSKQLNMNFKDGDKDECSSKC